MEELTVVIHKAYAVCFIYMPWQRLRVKVKAASGSCMIMELIGYVTIRHSLKPFPLYTSGFILGLCIKLLAWLRIFLCCPTLYTKDWMKEGGSVLFVL